MTATLGEALDRLGGSADEIAESLTIADITGKVNDACRCALARYLESLGFRNVAVVKDEAGWAVAADGQSTHPLGWDGPVVDFIDAFDARLYPHLIAERAA